QFTGQAGHIYGFLSVATDAAGNAEQTPLLAQATVNILQSDAISSITAVTPNPRNTPVPSIEITFSAPIKASTLDSSALSLTDTASPVAIPADISLSLVTGGTYEINGLAVATTAEGAYVLSVNAAGLTDFYGNPCVGSVSTSW